MLLLRCLFPFLFHDHSRSKEPSERIFAVGKDSDKYLPSEIVAEIQRNLKHPRDALAFGLVNRVSYRVFLQSETYRRFYAIPRYERRAIIRIAWDDYHKWVREFSEKKMCVIRKISLERDQRSLEVYAKAELRGDRATDMIIIGSFSPLLHKLHSELRSLILSPIPEYHD